ncbi:MAG: DMT family transporter [Spirulinaceae cyanobacterium]
MGKQWGVYVKLLLTAVIWGGTFIAGRVVVQEMGAFAAAFVRFAIASIALLLLLYRREKKLVFPARAQLLPLILLGLTGVFAYNAFFFLGLQTITASRAALIIALNPVAIAIGSVLFLQEKLSGLRWLGVATSVFGASIVISEGNLGALFAGNLGWGEVFLLGCVVSWCAYTLIGKSVMRGLSPLISTTYACVFGSIALALPAIAQGLFADLATLSFPATIGLFYLGLLGSAVGFNWYYEGVRQIGAAKASVFINFVPVSAVILGVLLLKEPLPLTLLLGGFFVILGVFLSNRPS